MPGGGTLVFAFGGSEALHLNNLGDVAFFAQLNTGDFGLYISSGGVLRLVAGTGTVIPGAGTITAVLPEGQANGTNVQGGAALNERGQLLFSAQVRDANGGLRVVLVVASPSSTAA
ncbi:MAG TPA: hypothetical protein VH137_05665 [Gemmatimonadales bacterium]|jgi:hypothetical protein|nr:hypothetical protein [Gemmatimonadales bacterium]